MAIHDSPEHSSAAWGQAGPWLASTARAGHPRPIGQTKPRKRGKEVHIGKKSVKCICLRAPSNIRILGLSPRTHLKEAVDDSGSYRKVSSGAVTNHCGRQTIQPTSLDRSEVFLHEPSLLEAPFHISAWEGAVTGCGREGEQDEISMLQEHCIPEPLMWLDCLLQWNL
eukprot:1140732-Pelagomonas_calceolata.AAC.4